MSILGTKDFRSFIKSRIDARESRGEYAKLARAIGIHTTTLSQILADKKPLSLEHAVLIADYLGLSNIESRYFRLLVQLDRSGSERLSNEIKKDLKELETEASELKKVIPHDNKLGPADKAVFYSSWMYSAVRVLSSIPKFKSEVDIRDQLGIPIGLFSSIVDFLLKTGLCIRTNGRLEPGPRYTHLEANSPFISRHHGNWRVKAMERHHAIENPELAYTSPMSISKKDAENVRKVLMETIKRINEIRDPSPCEEAYCLNVDWFKF